MKISDSPKVFISHASEDKDRFVIDFATKLRSNGVDAWVDQWELNVGDNLVDKIFEHGIQKASVFIVVISKYSIVKPWVKEELNAAFIKRIETNAKILPIVIDSEIEVPEILKNTVWEKINNLTNYEDNLKNILASIFGIYEKPEIGKKPIYTKSIFQIQNLSKIDSLVLKAMGEFVFQNNNDYLESDLLKKIVDQIQISEEDMIDSLEILEKNSYIKQTKYMGNNLPIVQLTTSGILIFSQTCEKNFENIYYNLISLIMNEKYTNSQEYALKLSCNPQLSHALIDYFKTHDFVKTINSIGVGLSIYDLTGTGKRYFREFLENNYIERTNK